MTLVAITWDPRAGVDRRGAVRLLDQTLLPGETRYRVVERTADLVADIVSLAVRGAPALGVAGALGVVLAMDEGAREGWDQDQLQAAVDRLRHARPTAVNLGWAVDRMRALMSEGRDAVLAAALELAAADEAANRQLSHLAADWLLHRVDRPRLRVLTHCNAGSLATSAWGTALGVIRELHARGRVELVYVDETRPLLQGSRLTAYELAADDIPYLVQVDSAAASTVARHLVDVAIVGADRITAGGDVANKVGTLGVALACRDAGIPFVVAAPWSTVDLTLSDGAGIEIEQRAADEVVAVGGVRVAPPDAPVHNPAFDVTPARLVDAVATERGVVEPARGRAPSELTAIPAVDMR
ncbi:MAG: S-methyl-5-thioribose-1-phosphate isomerase [Phycicoccus sp.]